MQINAPAVNKENVYIQDISLNARPYDKLYLDHFELMKGGKFDFIMTNIPNKTRVYKEAQLPFSMTNGRNQRRKDRDRRRY